MASLFTHAFVGTVLGQAGTSDWRKDWRFWGLIIVCSILPDIDSIGFHLGIPYSSFWGHRGITHSLIFAAILAVCVAAGFSRTLRHPWTLALLLLFVTAAHGLLDAMTDGGLGVAFFSPFDLQRYFLPWRPIHVSPIGVGRFFSARGLRILWSEILWVWLPVLGIWALAKAAQMLRRLWKKSPEVLSTTSD
jgi:inner membrane protein